MEAKKLNIEKEKNANEPEKIIVFTSKKKKKIVYKTKRSLAIIGQVNPLKRVLLYMFVSRAHDPCCASEKRTDQNDHLIIAINEYNI